MARLVGFFGQELSNFVSLPWKLDNPYYHNLYEDHHENCTLYDNYNVTVPDLDENQNLRYKISIAATSLRTNQIYIRVYILWINLIFQVGLLFNLRRFRLLFSEFTKFEFFVVKTNFGPIRRAVLTI